MLAVRRDAVVYVRRDLRRTKTCYIQAHSSMGRLWPTPLEGKLGTLCCHGGGPRGALGNDPQAETARLPLINIRLLIPDADSPESEGKLCSFPISSRLFAESLATGEAFHRPFASGSASISIMTTTSSTMRKVSPVLGADSPDMRR